jgi:hypothetical protein
VLVSLHSIEENAERERRLASVGHPIASASQGARYEAVLPSHDGIPLEADRSTFVDSPDPILPSSLLEEAMVHDSDDATISVRRFRMSGEGASKRVTFLAQQLQSLECEADRYFAIDNRLSSLSESELEELIVALPRYVTEAHQAELLGRIVVRVHGPQRKGVLALALSLVTSSAKKRALELVIPHVADTLKPELHDNWRDFLEEARRTDRHELFSSIETTAALIAGLGGDPGIIESIEAIDEIGRSWP